MTATTVDWITQQTNRYSAKWLVAYTEALVQGREVWIRNSMGFWDAMNAKPARKPARRS